MRAGLSPDDLPDWSRVCATIADAAPLTPPGTRTGYHSYTFGYLVGELACRVTGRSMRRLLHERIAAPLGVVGQLYFGVPEADLPRLARLEDAGPVEPADDDSILAPWERGRPPSAGRAVVAATPSPIPPAASRSRSPRTAFRPISPRHCASQICSANPLNNAGIFPYGTIDELTVEQFDETMAVHVRAVFTAVRAASAHVPAGGRIISIGSNLAERVPVPGIRLYAMSKGALLGFTKGLARDVGPRGITATLVHPGSTDTEMNPADSDDADAERALTALGRYATPADIAATVVHLAGPGGDYITGTAITVDGGAAA